MKKSFKIFAVIVTALSFCLIFTSCIPKKNDDSLKIVATIFPCYDFARAITGNKAELTLLVKPGSDIHTYEPSVVDIAKINACDIFIYIGGESDTPWVEDILSTILNDIISIRLMDYIDVVEEELIEGMQDEEEEHQHDEEEEEEETEYDEHIWTSPSNAITLINVLKNVIVENDPNNTATYNTNAASYISQINQLKQDFQSLVDESETKTIVVADRFPFRYFVDEFGLSYYAALKGCDHETAISIQTIAFLKNLVETNNIPCIFYVENGNIATAETIVETSNCEIALLHSCERPTQQEFENGYTYITYMQNNLTNLRKGLI